MKIAVSTTGDQLDSAIDPRFGRCAFFSIVDTENMAFEAFSNDSISLGGGAGIQSAQFVASKGAKVVITGNCGPNAMRTLSASGIQVILGQSGTVREAVERFNRGGLRPAADANVGEHYGMGGGMGRGMGMGRGGGMGGGMGMGRGMAGGGGAPDRKDPGTLSRKQELDMLKNYADGMQQEMEDIQNRIRKIEEDMPK